jgi:hypothetical protein
MGGKNYFINQRARIIKQNGRRRIQDATRKIQPGNLLPETDQHVPVCTIEGQHHQTLCLVFYFLDNIF